MQEKRLTNVNFSPRFKSLCESSGRTQKELAKVLEISEAAIVNYKKDRVPKAEELLRIAVYFNVTIEWLLTGVEPDGRSLPNASTAMWKNRAEEAERKVSAMKAGLIAFAKKF